LVLSRLLLVKSELKLVISSYITYPKNRLIPHNGIQERAIDVASASAAGISFKEKAILLATPKKR